MIRRHVLLLAAVASAAAAAVLAATILSRDPKPARPELELARAELTSGPARVAPGATAFLDGPQSELAFAAGVADTETGAPVHADARMRLESETRFVVALMQGRLLEPPQIAAIKTPPRAIGSSYALGLGVIQTPCGQAFTHNGGGAGFKTSVLVSGDGSRVSVLLLNGNTRDGRADAAAYAAAERLYCSA